MLVLLNGSYGVGKTTVGRILQKRLAGSALYNPEWFGSLLIRLPLTFRGSGTDDFQDIDLWRKSVVSGVKFFRFFAREIVIVPMAFCRQDYFSEIVGKLREFDKQVEIFCLTASFETILKRLEKRGENIRDGDKNWSVRKARICNEAHQNGDFGEPIATDKRSEHEIADEILKRLNLQK